MDFVGAWGTPLSQNTTKCPGSDTFIKRGVDKIEQRKLVNIKLSGSLVLPNKTGQIACIDKQSVVAS